MSRIRAVDLPPVPQRAAVPPVDVGDLRLDLGGCLYCLRTRVLVMGILNRTPDSFFDGGKYFDLDAALRHAEELIRDGADIIDIGGVRAGPGAYVSPEEELERVLPILAGVVERFDVPVSIDSYRSEVTREATAAGAVVVNDISGLADPEMIEIAVAREAAVVLCHIQGRPRIPNPEPRYEDLHAEVQAFLRERVGRCRGAGVPGDRIIVDHALDFGKNEEQSLDLFAHTRDLTELGQPVLVSASNKRFLGALTGTDVDRRGAASLAAVAYGIHQGARLARVHDARGTRRVADTICALLETTFEDDR